MVFYLVKPPPPRRAMVWSQMSPVSRSTGAEYTRRASRFRLARVMKKPPA
jgi:hypothetical protein